LEEFRSLEDLFDLQVVDLDIDRLLNRRQTLPELEQYRLAHERAAALDARLTDAEDRRRHAELAADKAQGELDMAEAKKKREERRLYAGGIGARDTENLRKEVEMLGRLASEREDQILELIDAREKTEAELAGLQAERREAQAEKDRLSAFIKEEWRVIDGDIARAEARKRVIVPLITPDLLSLYEDLRPHKEGVAVGRLADGICGGCHLRLSAAEQVEALRDFPPRCMHCRRILVPE
jgi:predicted  nucleic acid-binding Zn-ribbon protein